jgi:hypothetical protein
MCRTRLLVSIVLYQTSVVRLCQVSPIQLKGCADTVIAHQSLASHTHPDYALLLATPAYC